MLLEGMLALQLLQSAPVAPGRAAPGAGRRQQPPSRRHSRRLRLGPRRRSSCIFTRAFCRRTPILILIEKWVETRQHQGQASRPHPEVSRAERQTPRPRLRPERGRCERRRRDYGLGSRPGDWETSHDINTSRSNDNFHLMASDTFLAFTAPTLLLCCWRCCSSAADRTCNLRLRTMLPYRVSCCLV